MTHSDKVLALVIAFAAIIVVLGITVISVHAQTEGTKRQVACMDNGGSWSDGKCLIVGRH